MAERGGSDEQHQKAENMGAEARLRKSQNVERTRESMREPAMSGTRSGIEKTGVQGGTHEQHVNAGRQSHKKTNP